MNKSTSVVQKLIEGRLRAAAELCVGPGTGENAVTFAGNDGVIVYYNLNATNEVLTITAILNVDDEKIIEMTLIRQRDTGETTVNTSVTGELKKSIYHAKGNLFKALRVLGYVGYEHRNIDDIIDSINARTSTPVTVCTREVFGVNTKAISLPHGELYTRLGVLEMALNSGQPYSGSKPYITNPDKLVEELIKDLELENKRITGNGESSSNLDGDYVNINISKLKDH